MNLIKQQHFLVNNIIKTMLEISAENRIFDSTFRSDLSLGMYLLNSSTKYNFDYSTEFESMTENEQVSRNKLKH